MKISLAMVMSIDGRTTLGNQSNISSWTSPEDKSHFSNLIKQSDAVIMGMKTFEASKAMIMSRISTNTIRIVATSHPEQYVNIAVPGKLEFVSKSPSSIISDLKSRGYSKILLVGGSQLAEVFFANNLVDELVLTIEPTIFGLGTPLIAGKALYSISLTLESHQVLNATGTLLLYYKVNK